MMKRSILHTAVAGVLMSSVVACAAPENQGDGAGSAPTSSQAALERAAVEEVAIARQRDAEQAQALQLAEQRAQAEASVQAEREAQARAEAERRARAEEDRLAREAAERAEAERLAALEADARGQAEAEAAAARETAAQAQAAQMAAEQAEAARLAEIEAERQAAEQAEQERIAQQAAAAADAEAAQLAAAQAAVREPAAASASRSAASGSELIIPRTPENIARLGNDLTPMGSIRAGNEDGRIPPWEGGLTRADWPAGFQPGDRHLDPFSADQPLYVITGENFREHADRLSPGQIATFQRYPDTYFMRVYPTRRSASFPERIYEMTIRNASTGRLVSDGDGVADVAEGFPFPLPQDAYELMWNHKLKFKGTGGTRFSNQVTPTARGAFQLVRLREELLGLYYIEGNTIEDTDNILLYFFQEVESPARLAGNILLVHESLNQVVQPRQAWVYNPGQRRVRRAPNVAYDNPGTASDGLRTNDMTDMFNGAMDRFTWEIVGRKEMYVPYNSYRVHSGDLTPEDIVRPGHLNPELMRYQLHRVWVVDARLRPEFRHINSRRTFYLDEDSYQILLTDHYDGRGDVWRVSEAHSINYYDVPTFWSTIEVHMDLQSGRYVANGLDNQDPVNSFNVTLNPGMFTPQALRVRGRR
ncbi:MAG: DUF1329 domain-containing protein [Wenzhouxiangella sp.]